MSKSTTGSILPQGQTIRDLPWETSYTSTGMGGPNGDVTSNTCIIDVSLIILIYTDFFYVE